MITFKHFVQDDVQDDTLNLEIWKGEDFEIAVKVFLDDRVDIDLLNPDQTYSSSELVEILKIVVPFAIETASVHDSVRNAGLGKDNRPSSSLKSLRLRETNMGVGEANEEGIWSLSSFMFTANPLAF